MFGTLIGNLPFALIVAATIISTLANGSFSPAVSTLWYGGPGALGFVLIGMEPLQR